MSQKNVYIVFCVLLFVALVTINSSAKDTFIQGIRTESMYISESIGIRIDIDKDYVMATDEEIYNMMDIGKDYLLNKNIEKITYEISKLTTIQEMMAVNPYDRSVISVQAEKPLLPGITLEQYVSAYYSTIQDYFYLSDAKTVDWCDRIWIALNGIVSYQGIEAYSQLYFTEAGDRFATVDLTGPTADSIFRMQSFVSAYKRY